MKRSQLKQLVCLCEEEEDDEETRRGGVVTSFCFRTFIDARYPQNRKDT